MKRDEKNSYVRLLYVTGVCVAIYEYTYTIYEYT